MARYLARSVADEHLSPPIDSFPPRPAARLLAMRRGSYATGDETDCERAMKFNHHSPLDWLVVALILAGIWMSGCGTRSRSVYADSVSARLDPHEYGNYVVYHRATDGSVWMSYEADGDLCGIVMQDEDKIWQAWSLRQNWKRHNFNDKVTATKWLTSTWCKP